MMETMRFALAALIAVGTLSGQTPLQIVTDSLPAATPGVAYTQPIVTSGGNCQGSGTATSTIDAGVLPPGLTVVSPAGARQWTITGLPSVNGTFNFTLHVYFTLDR